MDEQREGNTNTTTPTPTPTPTPTTHPDTNTTNTNNHSKDEKTMSSATLALSTRTSRRTANPKASYRRALTVANSLSLSSKLSTLDPERGKLGTLDPERGKSTRNIVVPQSSLAGYVLVPNKRTIQVDTPILGKNIDTSEAKLYFFVGTDFYIADTEELRLFRTKTKMMAAELKKQNLISPLNFSFSAVSPNVYPHFLPPHFVVTLCHRKVKNTTFQFKKQDFQCSQSETVGHLISRAMPVLSRVEEWILKIVGKQEYIVNLETTLGSIEYVRKHLARKWKIDLKLVNKADVNLKLLDHIEASGSKCVIPLCTQSPHYGHELQQMSCFPHYQYDTPLKFMVLSIEKLAVDTILKWINEKVGDMFSTGSNDIASLKMFGINISIQFSLWYGMEEIDVFETTQKSTAFFSQSVQSKILIKDLPRETRLQYCVMFHFAKRPFQLAVGNMQLFDTNGFLPSGILNQYLQVQSDPIPKGIILDRTSIKSSMSLHLEFNFASIPVVFANEVSATPRNKQKPDPPNELSKEIKLLSEADILFKMIPVQKELLWFYRHYILKTYPNMIDKLLASINWLNPEQVNEMCRLIQKWPPIDPIIALRLLHPQFPSLVVREYAVKCIQELTSQNLVTYLLQLVELLIYEPYLDSSLIRFLLERSLRNRNSVGHYFFWHIKASIHNPYAAGKLAKYLESYLMYSADQIDSLGVQVEVMRRLKVVSLDIAKAKEQERKKILYEGLSKIKIPPKFHIPTHPLTAVKGLVVEKCKYMDSFTVPLWLVFENSEMDSDCVAVIFKSGDDLRQDHLTIQLLMQMDSLWKTSEKDCQMMIYGVLATGKNQGLIEVVPQSLTNAKIQKDAAGATGAFLKTPLARWLQSENSGEEEYSYAVSKFVVSCAGYCVASYVLGLGDRHNDNIMITKSGQLFHIDFGHFLGNTMKFGGYNRERAPFVMTPEYLHVMGGDKSENYKVFISYCLFIYQMLRENDHIFKTLLLLMVNSGLPELKSENDLEYIDKALRLNLPKEEAANQFITMIDESLNTRATQLNFFIHNLVHPG